MDASTEIDAMKKLRANYAVLSGRGEERAYQQRFQRAFADFEKLISLDGVLTVGVNLIENKLIVETECIECVDAREIVRMIGHLAIIFEIDPPKYCIFNPNPLSGSFAHPHAMQLNAMCMSDGAQEIHNAIRDARFSDATRVLIRALRMRKGTISTTFPYTNAGLENWPAKR